MTLKLQHTILGVLSQLNQTCIFCLPTKNLKKNNTIQLNPQLIVTFRTKCLYFLLIYYALKAIPFQFCAKFAIVGIA